jgi:hypothetical protein
MKLLHTADWQLGKPFASIDDDDNQALVRKARMDAIGEIRAIAAAERVTAVVVAGDLFDSPGAKASVVAAALAAIGKFPCPVYVIPGNHDHGGPGSVWTQGFFLREREQLAPNLVVCASPQPLVTAEYVIYPCPLARRAEAGDVCEWLRDPAAFAEAPAGLPRIVLAHGSVQDFGAAADDPEEDSGPANRIDLDRLPLEEIDYIALGDWHGTKQVGPKAWYSGTPEYDRFPKGADYVAGQVLVAGLARGAAPRVGAHPTGQLGWRAHRWEFREEGDLARLGDWVEATFGARTQKDLLKLHLHGALGLEQSRQLEQLLERLRARLLRVKLVDAVTLAPTAGELAALTGDAANPLIARVAATLGARAGESGEAADSARLALRELYLLRNQLAQPGER